MDNNFEQGQQYEQNTQYDQNVQNMQYGQNVQNMQYGQNVQNMQYGQNMQYNQQNQNTAGQYYSQQGYSQQVTRQVPKQSVNLGADIKNIQNKFRGKVSKMGLSRFCIMGIIAAVLLIVAPFMNFAAVHFSERVEVSRSGRTVQTAQTKVSVGFNLFELSQMGGTVDRVVDKLKGYDKDDIEDAFDDYSDDFVEDLEYGLDTDIDDSTVKEAMGIAALVLKGRMATLFTPWIIIICGLGLFIFTVINNRKMKLAFSIVPCGCLLWLMICSGNFFTVMGIGAWAMIIGIILGIVSALKDEAVS